MENMNNEVVVDTVKAVDEIKDVVENLNVEQVTELVPEAVNVVEKVKWTKKDSLVVGGIVAGVVVVGTATKRVYDHFKKGTPILPTFNFGKKTKLADVKEFPTHKEETKDLDEEHDTEDSNESNED